MELGKPICLMAAITVPEFRKYIQNIYKLRKGPHPKGDFGEILCYEIHSEPNNDRLHPGLTFKELAAKWGISVAFLGEIIADHCRKL